ncbi:MAG: hypothetical protein ACRQFF_00665 [Sphaerochaeta sp.]
MKCSRFGLRGGNYNNGSNAGLGYLNLNNERSNVNSNNEVRCAFSLLQEALIYGLKT